jgi:hypothetical protein
MWLALALGLSPAVVTPTPVEPTSAPGTFEWRAPAECPPATEVRAAVEGHLGMPLSELSISEWSVEGDVSRAADGGWSLDLVIDAPDGPTERTLHDPSDCRAVSDAAALLVALALDPEAVAASSEPETTASEPTATQAERAPRPEVREETATVPVPERPEPKEPAEENRGLPLDFVLGMAGGFDYGTLRGVSPIGRANFTWQLPRFRVGAIATFGGTPGFTVPAVAQDVSLWMWAAGIEAGPVFHAGAFEFPLTAGLEAGQLVIRPRILVPPPGQQVTWAALLLTPAAAWVPVRWLAIVLRAGATVSFVRPEFAIEGLGRVHAPAPVGFRATLGFEVRFPLGVMKTGGGGNPREPS